MTSIRDLFDRASDWNAWLDRVGDKRAAWEDAREHAALGELAPEYAALDEPRYVIAIADAESAESAASLPLLARALDTGDSPAELRFLDRHADAERLTRALGVVPAISPLCLVFDEDWTECGRWAPRQAAGSQVLREFLPVLRGEPTETRQPWKTLTHHLWRQVDRARRE